MADTNTRQGKRTPVTLKIKFKSETLEQFIERYAVDVSQGGIFIRTKEPLAVGTQMKFEFQLRDASPLIAGEGTVVWTRENDPSRPAIAPGMGVRFDRLADGSQSVLERILAEKAKQAPGRSGSVTAPGDSSKAAMFTDTPTKVAPAPVQEALGVKSRNRADSEQTPLPKPMPFHSDAEDFDEKAFEEATKVRSLDELVAQSALGDEPADDTKTATKIMPPDELAQRRQAGRADSTISDPPLAAPPEEPPVPHASVPDRESAPGLPSPPMVEPTRRPPTNPGIGAPAPARAASPSVPPATVTADPPAKTVLGIEPAKAQVSQPRMKAATGDGVPGAVAAEPSRPVAPSRPSSAPIIIGILVVVAASVAGVWWFFLREEVRQTIADSQTAGSSSITDTTPTGSADTTGSGSDVAMTGSAEAGSAEAGSGSADAAGSGSDVAMAGSGSADATAGSADATGSADAAGSADTTATVPAATRVATVITSPVRGAAVEIVGTTLKGTTPFTVQLDRGKAYKARVSAPGYTDLELDVQGGQRATAKLVLKPRIVTITTDPPGASIYIDGIDTGKVSPTELTLTPSQAARPRLRISMRRVGFRPVDSTIEAKAFEDAGGTMTTSVEAKLTPNTVRPPTTGSGSTGGGTDSGTTTPPTGTGDGSAATGDGGASGTDPTPPAPAPSTGTQPPAGSLNGSATPQATTPLEPEPAWTK